ncbi:hypothetical protein VTN77DRAFT_8047 [Rasamsonia byssochlamydoides]|uniref:uncharacterized protein n=1 Tax=Rasamsonia byssochlamydoides TaxID=89139 RepID=UPI0037422706
MSSDPFLEPKGKGQLTPSRSSRLAVSSAVSPPGPLVIHQPRPYDLLLRELDHLKTRLRETEDELDKAQSELKGSLFQRAQDAETITRLGSKNAELEDLVNKQKATITNQSRALADPNSLRNRRSAAPLAVSLPLPLPVTPRHQTTTQHSFDASVSNGGLHSAAPVFDMPPPSLNLPMPTPMLMPIPMNAAPLPSAPAAQLPAHHPLGPVPVMSPGDGLYHTYGFGPSSRSPVCDAFNIPSSCQSPGMLPHAHPPPHCDFEQKVAEFSARFHDLWTKSEAFGRTFAAEPNAWKDSHLDQRVKDYLMLISDCKVASYLLNNPLTRPLQVAKAINFYLVRDVLKITVIKGFDVVADDEIGKIKMQLGPGESSTFTYGYTCYMLEYHADKICVLADTPTTVRNMMFVAMAQQVNLVKEKPGFAEYFQRRQQDHLLQLWQLVGPLVSGNVSNAGEALGEIIADAHVLSVDMHSTPFETRFHFPETNEPFDLVTMVNVEPWLVNGSGSINGGPDHIPMYGSMRGERTSANNNRKVKLGITPIIRIGDHSPAVVAPAVAPTAAARVRLVQLGKVLLRIPSNNNNNRNNNNNTNNRNNNGNSINKDMRTNTFVNGNGVEQQREISPPKKMGRLPLPGRSLPVTVRLPGTLPVTLPLPRRSLPRPALNGLFDNYSPTKNGGE